MLTKNKETLEQRIKNFPLVRQRECIPASSSGILAIWQYVLVVPENRAEAKLTSAKVKIDLKPHVFASKCLKYAKIAHLTTKNVRMTREVGPTERARKVWVKMCANKIIERKKLTIYTSTNSIKHSRFRIPKRKIRKRMINNKEMQTLWFSFDLIVHRFDVCSIYASKGASMCSMMMNYARN